MPPARPGWRFGPLYLCSTSVSICAWFCACGTRPVPKGVGLLDARNTRIGHRKIQAQGRSTVILRKPKSWLSKILLTHWFLVWSRLGSMLSEFQQRFCVRLWQKSPYRRVMAARWSGVPSVPSPMRLRLSPSFFHLPGKVGGVDELHPAFALRGFAVGDDPHIGDAGVGRAWLGGRLSPPPACRFQ